jgi:hypothetical protein
VSTSCGLLLQLYGNNAGFLRQEFAICNIAVIEFVACNIAAIEFVACNIAAIAMFQFAQVSSSTSVLTLPFLVEAGGLLYKEN